MGVLSDFPKRYTFQQQKTIRIIAANRDWSQIWSTYGEACRIGALTMGQFLIKPGAKSSQAIRLDSPLRSCSDGEMEKSTAENCHLSRDKIRCKGVWGWLLFVVLGVQMGTFGAARVLVISCRFVTVFMIFSFHTPENCDCFSRCVIEFFARICSAEWTELWLHLLRAHVSDNWLLKID